MQRLVHILFGIADVVVELPGDGMPLLVDHAQGSVAVHCLFDQHPQGEKVVDIAELFALGLVFLHLEVGAVDAFGPADNFGGYAVLGEFVLKSGGNSLDVFFALGALGRQNLGYLPVLLFVEMPEGQVIQPPLDLPDTQPVGQGGVDVQGLLGDAPPLFGRQGVQGVHVVQAVRQLDQHHPDVLRHGDQHLAQALGVEGLSVVHEVGYIISRGLELVVHAGQLGDTVHQLHHFRTKAPVYLVQGNIAVFHHVMKQGGNDGVRV